MLDTLVNRQDGHVAGVGQAAGIVDPVQVVQNAAVTIGNAEDAIDDIGRRNMQRRRGNGRALMVQIKRGVRAKGFGNAIDHGVRKQEWQKRTKIRSIVASVGP